MTVAKKYLQEFESGIYREVRYEKINNSKNMAVCSRTVRVGNVIRYYFELARLFLSAGSGIDQPGTDGVYSTGACCAWYFYDYRRNHGIRKNF